ncbi:hypothetical protein LDENG_00255840, partial [Lucifuga dentata]
MLLGHSLILRSQHQVEEVCSFSLLEVCMSSKQVQRQTLMPEEKVLEKLQEIRKVANGVLPMAIKQFSSETSTTGQDKGRCRKASGSSE